MKVEGIDGNYTMIYSNYFGLRDKADGEVVLSKEQTKEICKPFINFTKNYKKWFDIADDRLKDAVVDGKVKRSSYELFIERQIRITENIKVIFDNTLEGVVYFNFLEFEKQHMAEYASKKVFDRVEDIYYRICKYKNIEYKSPNFLNDDYYFETKYEGKFKTYNKYLSVNTENPEDVKCINREMIDAYHLFKRNFENWYKTIEEEFLSLDKKSVFDSIMSFIYNKCRHYYARFDFSQFEKDYSNKYLADETISLAKDMLKKIVEQERKFRVVGTITIPTKPKKIKVLGIEGDYIMLVNNYFGVRDKNCGKAKISEQKRKELSKEFQDFTSNYKKWFTIADERLKDAVVDGKVKRNSYETFIDRQVEIAQDLKVIFDNVLIGNIYFNFQEFKKQHMKDYDPKEIYEELQKIWMFIIDLD